MQLVNSKSLARSILQAKAPEASWTPTTNRTRWASPKSATTKLLNRPRLHPQSRAQSESPSNSTALSLTFHCLKLLISSLRPSSKRVVMPKPIWNKWPQAPHKLKENILQSKMLETYHHLKRTTICLSETSWTILHLTMRCCMIILRTLKLHSCTWWTNISSYNSNTRKRRRMRRLCSFIEKEWRKSRRKEMKHWLKQLSSRRKLSWWTTWCSWQYKSSSFKRPRTLNWLISLKKKIWSWGSSWTFILKRKTTKQSIKA